MNAARWERLHEQEKRDERERRRPVFSPYDAGGFLAVRSIEERMAARKLEGHRHMVGSACTCGRTAEEVRGRIEKKKRLRRQRRARHDRRGW